MSITTARMFGDEHEILGWGAFELPLPGNRLLGRHCSPTTATDLFEHMLKDNKMGEVGSTGSILTRLKGICG
jgi:hypothetical protein